MSTPESPCLDNPVSPPSKKPRLDATGETSNSTPSTNGSTTSDSVPPPIMNNLSNGSVPNNNGSQLSAPQENGESIDEGLYSRQLYVLGRDAMNRMASSKVLVSGLGGLGVEVAKNVILGGVRSVTLHDTHVTTWKDLSSQFYLKKADIGKNRAELSHKQLSELNPYVSVDAVSTGLTDEFLKKFNVVVLTEVATNSELERISEFCHNNGIKFILANTRGLFSRVFCDFGESFVIHDVNGEQPISAMIASVAKDTSATVTCLDETRHGLEDGDHVTFSEVQGMTELNGCDPMKIEVTGPYTFKIGDTTGMSDYVRGGVVTQVKMKKTVSFKSLKNSIVQPECLITDFGKIDRPPTLNIAFQALDVFNEQKGRLPRPANREDANDLIQIAEKLSSDLGDNKVELNTNLLRVFSWGSSGNICPINGFIGGVVAQEVMKACSGKFQPISQWMFFDAIECLPFSLKDVESPRFSLDEADFQPSNERYDGQVAVFGNRFQGIISNLRYFVVGAGAIGCELLKNFSMIGLGSGDHGKVIVTDMDLIERSNLNRQFLFRSGDVGKAKSICAAEAVLVMNPGVKIECHENRVGPETEQVYDDQFFENLSGVANALDNIEARLYMDRKCVYYRLPLLESGTLGTKGNTQVVIPHLTECYGLSQDPPEKSIPICTLKNFPNAIEHTLQWARDLFEGVFKQSAENSVQFLADPEFLERTFSQSDSQSFEILESVHKCLIDERPSKFEDCVEWARFQWEEHFNNQIRQLLFTLPPDHTTSSGQPFWSGPKRCPHSLSYDRKDPLSNDFIFAAANLKAEMYGIQQVRNKEMVADMANAIKVPVFVPRSGIKIAVTDAEAQSQSVQLDSQRLDSIKKRLEELGDREAIKINPLEFEKDDDNNLHIDFIVAASNSRATNYGIAPADRLKSKLIAGKIIPAIATTTSVVAGLVGLELYKLATSGETTKLDRFKNGFVNLALPFFAFSEPIEAPKNRYTTEWTLWDRFEVEGEMTLGQFLDYFRKTYKLEVTMLIQGVSILFMTNSPRNAERMNLPLCEVVRRVSRKKLEPHVRALVFQLSCENKQGDDVEVPDVRYRIPDSQLTHFEKS